MTQLIGELDDSLAPWTVRDVDPQIRYRMKVQAVTKQMTLGELLNRTLGSWLDAGAPDDYFDAPRDEAA